MVEIKEKPLFGVAKPENKIDVRPQPKKPFDGFNVSFSTGMDVQKLKHEGMAMLRILSAKHAKGALSNKTDLKKLEALVASEISIKKGALPQELAVMKALYKIYK